MKSINFGTSIDSVHVQVRTPEQRTYQRRRRSSGGTSHLSRHSSLRSKRGEGQRVVASAYPISFWYALHDFEILTMQVYLNQWILRFAPRAPLLCVSLPSHLVLSQNTVSTVILALHGQGGELI